METKRSHLGRDWEGDYSVLAGRMDETRWESFASGI